MKSLATRTVAAALALGVSACSYSSTPSGPDQYGAMEVCRQFVQNHLKSPSTADFSNESASGYGSTWTVTGSVDSQNSFGGVVRNNYLCKAHSGDGENWTLDRLRGLVN